MDVRSDRLRLSAQHLRQCRQTDPDAQECSLQIPRPRTGHGKPDHLALHPFNRVPILRHGDLTIYETSAIAAYADEAFGGASLTPKDVKARARMNQWIGAVNSYYYPYMIHH